jgi:hypothetical protein
MVSFVRENRREPERVGAIFLSLTFSEAGTEDPTAPPPRHERARADALRMIDVILGGTGWRPSRVMPVVGALAYSHHNVIIRFAMKRTVRKARRTY